jgi:NAD-dependent SIR2 family protein deacetylase
MKESEVWRRVIELHERYEKQSCPECGQETTGTISEGGAKWALCPDCFRRLIEEGEADPPGGYGICKETGTLAQENIDGWE